MGEMVKRKPHLSPSQINMASRCMEQYRRRYIEGEKIPPGVAMIKGTAVHGANKVNMTQKMESRVDLPLAEIREAAAAEFDKSIAGGFLLTAEEQGRGPKTVIGEAKDEAVAMADFYGQCQAPDYQPVMVEKMIRITLPMCSHDLLGIVDLADDKDRVTDFKTAGRKKNKTEAEVSVQLTTYAAAFKAATGRDATELRLDTIVKTKKRISRDVLIGTRTPADYQVLANRMNAILASIKAGIFLPADPSSWACSTKFCGYAMTCPYFNPERKPQQESDGDE